MRSHAGGCRCVCARVCTRAGKSWCQMPSYVCMSMCMQVQVTKKARGIQSLELELQPGVSSLTSARIRIQLLCKAIFALICQLLFPDPSPLLLETVSRRTQNSQTRLSCRISKSQDAPVSTSTVLGLQNQNHCAHLLTWVLGIRTQVFLMLVWQMLYSLSISLSL